MNAVGQQQIADGYPQLFPVWMLDGRRILSAAYSARGRREYNEDRLGQLNDTRSAHWVLADGLGGHRGGARAAQLAVDSCLTSSAYASTAPLREALQNIVTDADVLIRAAQRGIPEYADMRTTVVVLSMRAGEIAWAHCGDSRLYHFRDGGLIWRTRDHSAVQLLVSAGELDESEIASHPDRSRLVSCLGGENSLLVSVRATGEKPREGDAFLLCSDGMWEHLGDRELEAAVVQASGPDALLVTLAEQVARAADANQDNYSAIAVFIGSG